MGRVTITLPRLGETMEEARVTDWLVAVGAAFRRGDVLLEVETDKTVVEVPALTDGVLLAQLVSPGQMVALDQPIAEVEAEGAEQTPTPEAAPTVAPAPVAAVARHSPALGTRPAASPAARAVARARGVDLTRIAGSGRRGRITAEDVAGATIVLLHGLFDDARGWRDLPRRLEATGARVVALDLPGHGENAAIAHSFDDVVDQMAARLAQAVPRGALHLVGHSLGAVIAARLAQHLGPRVTGLTLLAPAGIGSPVAQGFVDGMLGTTSTEALAPVLDWLDAGPVSASGLVAELARLQARRAGHAGLAGIAAHLPDITGDLGRLACPVRVMFGTQDRILDWRSVANLPAEVSIHLLRGVGHLPHHAQADLFIRLVQPVAHRPAILHAPRTGTPQERIAQA